MMAIGFMSGKNNVCCAFKWFAIMDKTLNLRAVFAVFHRISVACWLLFWTKKDGHLRGAKKKKSTRNSMNRRLQMAFHRGLKGIEITSEQTQFG